MYVTSNQGYKRMPSLARVLQQETRDEPGISVSVVHPGGVNTPIYYQGASYAGSSLA